MTTIAKKAKSNGELVYAYRQGNRAYNFNDVGPWGKVRNGYCAALSMQWMKLRLQGSDLAFDLMSRSAEKADWCVTKYHNYSKMSGEGYGYDFVLQEHGIQRNNSTSFPGSPNAMLLTNAVSGTGVYMIQFKREDGGHMAAIHNDCKEFHYFDANHGHFAFKSMGRFYEWFQQFLIDSGYRNKYNVKTILTPVTWSQERSVASLRHRFGG